MILKNQLNSPFFNNSCTDSLKTTNFYVDKGKSKLYTGNSTVSNNKSCTLNVYIIIGQTFDPHYGKIVGSNRSKERGLKISTCT